VTACVGPECLQIIWMIKYWDSVEHTSKWVN
jgi:hypothetical protein